MPVNKVEKVSEAQQSGNIQKKSQATSSVTAKKTTTTKKIQRTSPIATNAAINTSARLQQSYGQKINTAALQSHTTTSQSAQQAAPNGWGDFIDNIKQSFFQLDSSTQQTVSNQAFNLSYSVYDSYIAGIKQDFVSFNEDIQNYLDGNPIQGQGQDIAANSSQQTQATTTPDKGKEIVNDINTGKKYLASKQYLKAFDSFSSAYNIDRKLSSSKTEILYFLGITAQACGDPKISKYAVTYYEKFLKSPFVTNLQKPNKQQQSVIKLAQAYVNKLKGFDKIDNKDANKLLSKGLALYQQAQDLAQKANDPKYSADEKTAILKQSTEKYKEAYKLLKKAVDTDGSITKKSPGIYFFLAITLYSTNPKKKEEIKLDEQYFKDYMQITTLSKDAKEMATRQLQNLQAMLSIDDPKYKDWSVDKLLSTAYATEQNVVNKKIAAKDQAKSLNSAFLMFQLAYKKGNDSFPSTNKYQYYYAASTTGLYSGNPEYATMGKKFLKEYISKMPAPKKADSKYAKSIDALKKQVQPGGQADLLIMQGYLSKNKFLQAYRYGKKIIDQVGAKPLPSPKIYYFMGLAAEHAYAEPTKKADKKDQDPETTVQAPPNYYATDVDINGTKESYIRILESARHYFQKYKDTAQNDKSFDTINKSIAKEVDQGGMQMQYATMLFQQVCGSPINKYNKNNYVKLLNYLKQLLYQHPNQATQGNLYYMLGSVSNNLGVQTNLSEYFTAAKGYYKNYLNKVDKAKQNPNIVKMISHYVAGAQNESAAGLGECFSQFSAFMNQMDYEKAYILGKQILAKYGDQLKNPQSKNYNPIFFYQMAQATQYIPSHDFSNHLLDEAFAGKLSEPGYYDKGQQTSWAGEAQSQAHQKEALSYYKEFCSMQKPPKMKDDKWSQLIANTQISIAMINTQLSQAGSYSQIGTTYSSNKQKIINAIAILQASYNKYYSKANTGTKARLDNQLASLYYNLSWNKSVAGIGDEHKFYLEKAGKFNNAAKKLYGHLEGNVSAKLSKIHSQDQSSGGYSDGVGSVNLTSFADYQSEALNKNKEDIEKSINNLGIMNAQAKARYYAQMQPPQMEKALEIIEDVATPQALKANPVLYFTLAQYELSQNPPNYTKAKEDMAYLKSAIKSKDHPKQYAYLLTSIDSLCYRINNPSAIDQVSNFLTNNLGGFGKWLGQILQGSSNLFIVREDFMVMKSMEWGTVEKKFLSTREMGEDWHLSKAAKFTLRGEAEEMKGIDQQIEQTKKFIEEKELELEGGGIRSLEKAGEIVSKADLGFRGSKAARDVVLKPLSKVAEAAGKKFNIQQKPSLDEQIAEKEAQLDAKEVGSKEHQSAKKELDLLKAKKEIIQSSLKTLKEKSELLNKRKEALIERAQQSKSELLQDNSNFREVVDQQLKETKFRGEGMIHDNEMAIKNAQLQEQEAIAAENRLEAQENLNQNDIEQLQGLKNQIANSENTIKELEQANEHIRKQLGLVEEQMSGNDLMAAEGNLANKENTVNELQNQLDHLNTVEKQYGTFSQESSNTRKQKSHVEEELAIAKKELKQAKEAVAQAKEKHEGDVDKERKEKIEENLQNQKEQITTNIANLETQIINVENTDKAPEHPLEMAGEAEKKRLSEALTAEVQKLEKTNKMLKDPLKAVEDIKQSYKEVQNDIDGIKAKMASNSATVNDQELINQKNELEVNRYSLAKQYSELTGTSIPPGVQTDFDQVSIANANKQIQDINDKIDDIKRPKEVDGAIEMQDLKSTRNQIAALEQERDSLETQKIQYEQSIQSLQEERPAETSNESIFGSVENQSGTRFGSMTASEQGGKSLYSSLREGMKFGGDISGKSYSLSNADGLVSGGTALGADVTGYAQPNFWGLGETLASAQSFVYGIKEQVGFQSSLAGGSSGQASYSAHVLNAEARTYQMIYGGSTGSGRGIGGIYGAQARITVADFQGQASLTLGGNITVNGQRMPAAVVSANSYAFVGASTNAEGGVGIGSKGADIMANVSAFAGASAGGSIGVNAGAAGMTLMGQAWAGEGAKISADASYHDGKLTFEFGIGAALGVGGYVQMADTINLKAFFDNKSLSTAVTEFSTGDVAGGVYLGATALLDGVERGTASIIQGASDAMGGILGLAVGGIDKLFGGNFAKTAAKVTKAISGAINDTVDVINDTLTALTHFWKGDTWKKLGESLKKLWPNNW